MRRRDVPRDESVMSEREYRSRYVTWMWLISLAFDTARNAHSCRNFARQWKLLDMSETMDEYAL